MKKHTPNPSREGKYGAYLFKAGKVKDRKVANYASPLERGQGRVL